MLNVVNMTWKGWVIEESLEDKSVLSRLKIVKSIVERNEEADQVMSWHLNTVEVDDADVDMIAKELEKQIKSGWYTHFTDFNNLLIVFRGKSFKIRVEESPKEGETGAVKFRANPADLKIWKDARRYGINKGKVDPRYIITVE